MIFVVHEPMGFEPKFMQIHSFLSRNSIANMLIIAKTVMHGTFCFAIENVADPLVFKEKICFKHVFSLQNKRVERQFQAETDGPDAMGASGISQPHDLAKVDDFETLSP